MHGLYGWAGGYTGRNACVIMFLFFTVLENIPFLVGWSTRREKEKKNIRILNDSQ